MYSIYIVYTYTFRIPRKFDGCWIEKADKDMHESTLSRLNLPRCLTCMQQQQCTIMAFCISHFFSTLESKKISTLELFTNPLNRECMCIQKDLQFTNQMDIPFLLMLHCIECTKISLDPISKQKLEHATKQSWRKFHTYKGLNIPMIVVS